MVHDDVWTTAGLDPFDGYLCIRCLETRLARPLTGHDFPAYPINEPDACYDTPRLAALKRAAWRLHIATCEPDCHHYNEPRSTCLTDELVSPIADPEDGSTL